MIDVFDGRESHCYNNSGRCRSLEGGRKPSGETAEKPSVTQFHVRLIDNIQVDNYDLMPTIN